MAKLVTSLSKEAVGRNEDTYYYYKLRTKSGNDLTVRFPAINVINPIFVMEGVITLIDLNDCQIHIDIGSIESISDTYS